MLSQGQVEQYYQQGYLITETIDSDLLQRLREVASVEATEARAANPNGGGDTYPG